MGYFQVRYNSRVVIYERKMFIRLTTGHQIQNSFYEAGKHFWENELNLKFDSDKFGFFNFSCVINRAILY